jgi:hypothetical protein
MCLDEPTQCSAVTKANTERLKDGIERRRYPARWEPETKSQNLPQRAAENVDIPISQYFPSPHTGCIAAA